MLIKKMYQGTVPDNKILNTESNSETDTYSCKKINEKIGEASNQGSDISIDLIYPIGSVYITTANIDPNNVFQGTRWERLPDRFLVGAGNLYANGDTGGSKDAVVVAHSHTVNGSAANNGAHTHNTSGTAASNGAHTHSTSGTAASNGAHEHTINGTAATGGSHSHNVGRDRDCASGSANWSVHVAGVSGAKGTSPTSTHDGHTHTVTGTAASNGAHTHTVSGTAASNGAHTHSVTGTAASNGNHTHTVSGTADATGVSGTDANLPPYLAVYMWARVS